MHAKLVPGDPTLLRHEIFCDCTGDAAQALGPAIMTVFIVFGGYYANASNVPRGLRWIAHTSLIKYAFEAFCVNEFRGLTFVNDKPGARVGSEAGEEVRPGHCPSTSDPELCI